MSQKIFTFWEPKEKVPGYIQLCMETWRKFLPDAEVVVCDYQSIRNYLSEEEFAAIDFRKMPLAKQSDAIRCALLKKHGGIWMDADTIITTSSIIPRLQQGECCMINNGKKHNLYGAFIYAAMPDCEFIRAWHNQLVPRITAYKKAWKFRLFRFLFHRAWKQMKSWDYCANAIIDPLAKQMRAPQFIELEGGEWQVTPERLCVQPGETAYEAYLRYWFKKETTEERMAPPIIFLHNSWTPEGYRQMSPSEFLQADIPLARLLNNLINKS